MAQPLPADNLPASLLLPMGRFGPAFLAYQNFQVYLQWNNSLVYSTTAAYLATRIAGAPALRHGTPPPALAFEEVQEMQTLLVRAGYDVGKVDGFLGLKTRQAVKAMQLKYGLPGRFLSDGRTARAHARRGVAVPYIINRICWRLFASATVRVGAPNPLFSCQTAPPA